MKQTAVEWLEIELKKKGFDFPYVTLKIEKAKEMEKQQQGYSEEDMKEAFNAFKTGKSFKEWFEQFKNK